METNQLDYNNQVNNSNGVDVGEIIKKDGMGNYSKHSPSHFINVYLKLLLKQTQMSDIWGSEL